MKYKHSLRRFLAIAGSSLLAVSHSHAASGTWNVDADGLWSVAGNWTPGIADGSGFTANFTNNITVDRTVSLDSARTLTGLVFDDSDTATAGSWILNNNATPANVLTLAGTTPGITVNALGTGKSATISAIIGGSAGLVKSGNGTLILSGANTYTGTTTISAGELRLSGSAFTTTAGRTYQINPGAVMSFGASGSIPNGTNTTIQGTGTLRVLNGVTISGGTGTRKINMNLGAGAVIDVQAGGSLGNGYQPIVWTNNQATLNMDGTIDLWDDNAIIAAALTGSGTISSTSNTAATPSLTLGVNNGSGTFSGSITAAGTRTISLIKTGTGTQVFSGSTTFRGTTTINTNGGTLQYAKTNSLYAGVTTDWVKTKIIVNSGGTIAFNVGGTNEFTTGNVTTLLTGLGGAVNNNGLLAGSTIAFDTTNASGGTFTIADTIANTTGTGGGAVGLKKIGTNTLVLSGPNTYTGNTLVSAGVLQLGNTLALQNSAYNTASVNGGLDVTGYATPTLGGLTGSVNLSSTLITGYGSISNLTLNPQTGITQTYSGDVGNGNGSMALTKTGAGTQILSGTNTHTGLTSVNVGTLLTTKALALPGYNAASRVTVASGATLAVNVDSGGWTSGEIDALLGATTAAFTSGSNLGMEVTTGSFTYANDIGATQAAKSLVKSGAGTLVLSGSNTYSGLTTVSTGTLSLGHVTDTLSSSSAVTVDGATAVLSIGANSDTVGAVSLKNGGSIAGTGGTLTGASYAVESGSISAKLGGAGIALTKSTAGTVTLTGANTYTGGSTLGAGTLSFTTGGLGTTGNITFTGNSTLQWGTTTTTDLSSRLVMSNGVTSTLDTTGNTVTFASAIGSSTSGALTKIGAGTLTLQGANTYTGLTTISAGVLKITNGSALGSTTSGTTQSGSSALEIDGSGGAVVVGSEAITINGGGISNTGAIRNIAGSNTYGGTVTLAAQSRINSDSGTLTLNNATAVTGAAQNLVMGGAGNITISGAITTTTGFLSKDGAGTVTLSGTNTYTGATSVSAGTLQYNGSLTGAGSAVDVSGTGTLGVGASANIARNVNISSGAVNLAGTVTGTLTVTGGAVSTSAGSPTVTNADFAGAGTVAASTPLAITNQLKLNGGASATLTGGTSFTAQGANLANNNTARTFTLSGGTMTLAQTESILPTVGSGPSLWLDASDASTLFTNTAGTTAVSGNGQSVARWNSKAGGYSLQQGTAGNQPVYATNQAQGRSIVDFGAFQGNTSGDYLTLYNSGGTTTELNLGSSANTVFMIVKGSIFLLGNSTTYDFHRGAALNPTAQIWDSTYTDASIKSGTTYLNKTVVNGTTTGLTGGSTYDLVDFKTTGTGNARFNSLARDRTFRTGGMQYGELLVFSGALSDADRQSVENYLYGKWITGLGTSSASVNYISTTIAATASSTLDLGYTAGAHSLASLNLTAGSTSTDLLLAKGASLTLNGDASNNAISATGSAGHTASIQPAATNPLGSLIIGAGKNISVAPGVALTVQSVISGGALNKIGEGSLTLSAANTYTGATTVSAGTLFVSGSLTSDVTVSDNATLGGGGLVDDLILGGGSLFDMFEAVTNTDSLTATAVSFAATGFGVDNLVYNGAAVNWGSIADGTYTLITGTLDETNLGNFGIGNAYLFGDGRGAYFQEGSLQLVVAPIPEPRAALLGGLGMLMLLRRRRRS